MRLLTALVTVFVVVSVAAASASSEPPRDLSVSYLFSGPGHLTRLASGSTYQTSEFPIALRVTTPDGSWSGAQWKTGRLGCCGTINGVGNYGGPPFFGWAAFGQGGTNPKIPPQGFFVIETAYARTPSVAATVAGLRTRGTGATYEPSTQVKLAGYSGIQFDGKVVGTKHLFVPFGAPTHNAHYFPDSIAVEQQGQVFRFIVLNARGKTVVVYLVNAGLAADQFPAFLTKADQLLKSLRFPG